MPPQISRVPLLGTLVTLGLCFWSSLAACAATIAAADISFAQDQTEARLVIEIAPLPGELISGLQFELTFDESAFQLKTLTASSAAQTAGKAVSFNHSASNRFRAIVAGLNQNHITAGPVAEAVIQRRPNAKAGSYPITLENVVLSNPHGRAVSCTAIPGKITLVGGLPPDLAPPQSKPPACGCGSQEAPIKTTLGDAVILALTAAGLAGAILRRRNQH